MATVMLFGAFGDMAGWTERRIEAATLGDLKAEIVMADDRFASRLDHPSTLLILNGTVIPHSLRRNDRGLDPSDEIAFGPPVSGG